MPAPALKHLATQAGIPHERAESLWNKAKDIVGKEYKYSKKSPNHWALVMGTVKKMMGIKKAKNESFTFKDFLVTIEAENDQD